MAGGGAETTGAKLPLLPPLPAPLDDGWGGCGGRGDGAGKGDPSCLRLSDGTFPCPPSEPLPMTVCGDGAAGMSDDDTGREDEGKERWYGSRGREIRPLDR